MNLKKELIAFSVMLLSCVHLMAQSINMKLSNVTVRKAMTELKQMSGYSFVYEADDLNTSKRVSINATTVNQAVDQILKGQEVTYEINGKNIIISRIRNAGGNRQASAAGRHLSGTVRDETGEPLVGVSILVNGTNNGSITDVYGSFHISNIGSNATLTVSYVGYETQQVKVGTSNNITITMQSGDEMLDDVVVIGYGTMKKRDLTGAIASVKSDDLVRTPSSNVMEAVQGKVAGFDIIRTSGELDSNLTMALRGNRSIYGNNAPLFIIDGMEGSFNELNPNDIESVEVLKDASSTAIYGAAGANGVIIITTKNPDKGKFSLNLDTYYGWNVVAGFPEINSRDNYINFRREALRTTGEWNSPADDGKLFPGYMQDLIDNDQWIDWFDLASNTGNTQSYNLSTSYATDKLNSYFSLAYIDVDGIYKGEEMKRYSARAKFDFKANRYVNYGMNLYAMYGNHDRHAPRVWNRILCAPPLGTPFDESGDVVKYPVGGDTEWVNPLLNSGKDQYVNNNKTISISPQVYVEVKPIEGLSLKSILDGYFRNRRQGIYNGERSFNGRSSASVPNTLTYNYKWQNILTYRLNIAEKHELTLTGVTEWQKKRNEVTTANANTFDVDSYAFHNLGAATGTPTVSSSYVQSQTMSYVARINYSLLGRYLFTLSSRWDGSSMLAEGKKWDVFPAGAFAWRISDEPFMKNVKPVSNLKLRLSYGVTGNAGAEEYATLDFSRTGIIGFQDVPQAYSGFSQNVANLDLGWEKSSMFNVGLDIGLFKGRIDITADWYKTKTKDLLFQKQMPYEAGGYNQSSFTIWTNVGETSNTGFELAITSHNIQNSNFTWDTSLTFATNKERVEKTTSDGPLQFGKDYYLIPGQPMHTFYRYKYLGIWGTDEAAEAAKYGQQPGEIHVAENGTPDYKLNTDDYYVIGNGDPKWTAGLTNNFTFKNFDLNIHIIARWDYMIRYKITEWFRNNGLYPSPTICDYWTPENQGARYPRPNADKSQDSYATNASLNIYDGSYLKIKTISLGYSLPRNVLKKVNIESMRVYFTASNPFIFAKSHYLKDYDVEKGGNDDDAPLSRQFILGFNVSF